MPLTSKDVLAIRDGVVKEAKDRGETLTPAQLVMGTRTMVHARLQAENPPPYPLPDAPKGKTDRDFLVALCKTEDPKEHARLHVEHHQLLAARKAQMMASVTVEDHMAYNALNPKPANVADAHHYAQWRHFKGLWEQTDKLITDAGVK